MVGDGAALGKYEEFVGLRRRQGDRKGKTMQEILECITRVAVSLGA